MQVFDFDKTLYRYYSAKIFYLYCLCRRPWLILLLPYQGILALLFALRLLKRGSFKARFFTFLHLIPDANAYARAFWAKQEKNLFPWYKKIAQPDDVLISASPRFLLEPICERLGIQNLIATEMDPHTGCITGENCYGAEKPLRFRVLFPDAAIERFYSDSLSDTPMARLAAESFLVQKDGSLSPWPEV